MTLVPSPDISSALPEKLETRLRTAEDSLLKLQTRMDHIDDTNRIFREEVRGDLRQIREDFNTFSSDMLGAMKDLSADLKNTKSIRTWVIGSIATTLASTGTVVTVAAWNVFKAHWMQ